MFFVLDWYCKASYWSCYFFWWFVGRQVICTNVQDEMIRTAPYRWFYVIVHTVFFAPEKVLTNTLQFTFNILDISHPLRCFTILFPMTNIDFSFFSPFGLSILWSPAVIVFCELQLLSNDLTTAKFLLTFLDVSSSCLSFGFLFLY